MKCPYCVSQISDEALTCPHCAHDLYLFKPLRDKIEALEKEVGELRAKMVDSLNAAAVPEPLPTLPQTIASIAWLWLLPLGLLLAAHGVITIVYDLNTLYLRVVSLLVPLPFGFMLLNSRYRHFGVWGLAAFVMAALAVLGMSGITHLVDQTPVLPQNAREWREFLEYAASVGLSYMTGMVLGRMSWRRRMAARRSIQVQGLAEKLAKLISDDRTSAAKVRALAEKLNKVGSPLAAAATSAASLYTGLRGLLGGGG